MPRYQRDEERERRVIDGRAPQADLTQNHPMTQPSGTPAVTWANTFRNSQTGQTTSPWAAGVLAKTNAAIAPVSLGSVTAQPGIASAVLDEIMPKAVAPISAPPVTPALRPAPPPLTELAQGGLNHAQLWTARVGQSGIMTGNNNTRALTSPYGSGAATFGGGPRTPFIGGANGQNVAKDYAAGGRYSSYKKDTDPTLSWGSAFR